ncbi:hypothetical protein DPX16_20212 [Anabarilius grahami]|uniref:Uncharacterized protein n=1 Tax=Anabarilius grahami TaxID=495550 RepID=A0A3N0XE92_ANAGA|nr:hypothetical protein DPX16_20212 [Anabarilius grahami]
MLVLILLAGDIHLNPGPTTFEYHTSLVEVISGSGDTAQMTPPLITPVPHVAELEGMLALSQELPEQCYAGKRSVLEPRVRMRPRRKLSSGQDSETVKSSIDRECNPEKTAATISKGSEQHGRNGAGVGKLTIIVNCCIYQHKVVTFTQFPVPCPEQPGKICSLHPIHECTFRENIQPWWSDFGGGKS